MKPYYEDSAVTIYMGDALECLRAMPDESVQCCVTSPPYWGLRDYGTAEWVGGDADCSHTKPDRQGTTGQRADRTTGHGDLYRDSCPCGAVRVDAQLGLEATPEEYVSKMVEVFREVRRVLRDDGTLWLNLGDSYQSGRGESHGVDPKSGARRFGKRPQDGIVPGLKPKDLVGIPWRVAFALQADGWYLRSDIIWAKPNPMPESVTDRPTKSHEYVFLLTKSARYYYDAEAIREADLGTDHTRNILAKPEPSGGLLPMHSGIRVAAGRNGYGRNKRTVWTITTKPYAEAHFATFPPELPEICIKAGCPKGSTVLDLFAGAGTTSWVAKELGRKSIAIELNPEYCDLIVSRCAQNGRRRPACHFIVEAWTAPLPLDAKVRKCAPCVAMLKTRERASNVRRVLGTRWPFAVCLTDLASAAKVPRPMAEGVADELVVTGLASYTETKSGRRRYYARRALVEETGRTFGMGGA